jgi:hypothetical protein
VPDSDFIGAIVASSHRRIVAVNSIICQQQLIGDLLTCACGRASDNNNIVITTATDHHQTTLTCRRTVAIAVQLRALSTGLHVVA